MIKYTKNRFIRMYIILCFLLLLILSLIIMSYSWLLGSLGIIIVGIFIYIFYLSESTKSNEIDEYIKTIQYRVKKAGTDVIQNLDIGIILYDEEDRIVWHNNYINIITKKDNIIGEKIYNIIPEIKKSDEKKEFEVKYDGNIYKVKINFNERLLYFIDITEHVLILEKQNNERPVLGILHFDNLDEVTKGMDDLNRSFLLNEVTSKINEWANGLNIYLKRFAVDKFLIITNQKTLEIIEKTGFALFDIVREITKDYKIPLTLSIGIGAGVDSFIKLSELAQTSLDITLGRGGDQAAVKFRDKITFYGGKSDAVEKRTRVRARVISHALMDLIKESDLVLIMGHKVPDMDAIGSAIGILKSVKISGKKGFIILNNSNIMIKGLIDEIIIQEDYSEYFMTSDKAQNLVTEKTLLIMVDNHKPSLAIEPKLIEMIEKIVVIDHHRRGEEIVENIVLSYIEPYASSTSELVTELLQYQDSKLKLSRIEASSLLAGIIVDTKSFAYRTGYRTFEAASFLKTKGADMILIQSLLKEDIKNYIKRAELVKKAKIIFQDIAIVVAEEKLDQMEIAQVADTLVEMNGILASFVISKRFDGLISISARSLGEINVQVIMEHLGGGGHLTNASAQFDELTLEQAEEKLVNVLQTTLDKGGQRK